MKNKLAKICGTILLIAIFSISANTLEVIAATVVLDSVTCNVSSPSASTWYNTNVGISATGTVTASVISDAGSAIVTLYYRYTRIGSSIWSIWISAGTDSVSLTGPGDSDTYSISGSANVDSWDDFTFEIYASASASNTVTSSTTTKTPVYVTDYTSISVSADVTVPTNNYHYTYGTGATSFSGTVSITLSGGSGTYSYTYDTYHKVNSEGEYTDAVSGDSGSSSYSNSESQSYTVNGYTVDTTHTYRFRMDSLSITKNGLARSYSTTDSDTHNWYHDAEVTGPTYYVEIGNPYHGEHFDYYDTSESFSVRVYCDEACTDVDIFLREDSTDSYTQVANGISLSAGVWSSYYTMTVNPANYAEIIAHYARGYVYDDGSSQASDQNTWYRNAEPPPTYYPQFILSNPDETYSTYNYTEYGTIYELDWLLKDLDDTSITTMTLWINDELNQTWNNPSAGTLGTQYLKNITIDSSSVYELTFTGIDGDGQNTTDTYYITGVGYTGGNVITTIQDAWDQYWINSNPQFKFDSYDPNGLNNLSLIIEGDAFISAETNWTSTFINIDVNTAYTNYTTFTDNYRLLAVSETINSILKTSYTNFTEWTGTEHASYPNDLSYSTNEDGTGVTGIAYNWDDTSGERTSDGVLIYQKAGCSNDYLHFYFRDSDFQNSPIDLSTHYVVETRMRILNDSSNYDRWGMDVKLSSGLYGRMTYYPATQTLRAGAISSFYYGQGGFVGGEYDDYSVNLADGNWHSFNIEVYCSEYVIYRIDGFQVRNGTFEADYGTEYMDFEQMSTGVNVEVSVRSTNDACYEIDYILSSDLSTTTWIASTSSEVGLSTTYTIPTGSVWGGTYWYNITTSQRAKINSTITYSREINFVRFWSETNGTDTTSDQICNNTTIISYAVSETYCSWNISISFSDIKKEISESEGIYQIDDGDYVDTDDYKFEDEDGNNDAWQNSGAGQTAERLDGIGYFTWSVTANNEYLKLARTDTPRWSSLQPTEYWIEGKFRRNETDVNTGLYGYNFHVINSAGMFATIFFDVSDNKVAFGFHNSYYGAYEYYMSGGDTGWQEEPYSEDFTLGINCWQTCKIYINSVNNTATFYINGTQYYTHQSSTYIPDSSYFTYLQFTARRVSDTHRIDIDYLYLGDYDSVEWTDSTISEVGLCYSVVCLPFYWGYDYQLNYTSIQKCRFDSTLSWNQFEQYSWIYTDSTSTTKTDYFSFTDNLWNSLDDGLISFQLRLGDDDGYLLLFNESIYKDTNIIEPNAWLPANNTEYYSTYLPGFSFGMDWEENQGEENWIYLYLDENETNPGYWQWNVQEEMPDDFPRYDQALVTSSGTHVLKIVVKDSAGNEAMVRVFFEIVYEKPISFVCYQLEHEEIDIDEYLHIYLNDIEKRQTDTVFANEFDIVIKDNFGNTIYTEENVEYNTTLTFNVPLREVDFYNPNEIVCYYKVVSGIYESGFWIGATNITQYNLYDGNYTIIVYPGREYKEEGVMWVVNSTAFEVENGMDTVSCSLDYVESYIVKPILFTLTSSIDGLSVDAEKYCNIFLDEQPVTYSDTTTKNSFNITIYDKFGQILYNQTSVSYASNFQISVALREIPFYNPNDVICYYNIAKNRYDEGFWIGRTENTSYYLYDGNYSVIGEPGDEYKEEGVQWLANSTSFIVNVNTTTVSVTLGELEVSFDKPLTFIVRSSIDGEVINNEKYLRIYVDGIFLQTGSMMTTKSSFDYTIEDAFGTTLREVENQTYVAVIEIQLALRKVYFYNPNSVHCYYTITKGDGDLSFWIDPSRTAYKYLQDNTYTLVATPGEVYKQPGVQYLISSTIFIVNGDTETIRVTLKTFNVDVDVEIEESGPITLSRLISWFQTGNGETQTYIFITIGILLIVILPTNAANISQNARILRWTKGTHTQTKNVAKQVKKKTKKSSN